MFERGYLSMLLLVASFFVTNSLSALTTGTTTINLPTVYSSWTLDQVLGTAKGFQIVKLTQGTQSMTVLIEGNRLVERSNTAFVELNFQSQTGFAAVESDNQVYMAKSDNRNKVQAVSVKATGALFSVGKWTALKSTDTAKAIVFNTQNSTTQYSESNLGDCQKIFQANCTNPGDNKIYCLEWNDAGTEQFLIYYTMPTCERLQYSARITRSYPANTLQTISSQGQLLAVCSTSKSALTASCQIFDLKASLFALQNPDTSQPIKTIDYSMTTSITEVNSFRFLLEWGCVFYTATTSSSTAWNVIYKCQSDSSQGSISSSDLPTPVSPLVINNGGYTVSFKISSSSLIQMILTRNDDLTLPNNCEKYNTDIGFCYQCKNFTTLRPQGDCSDPQKFYLDPQYYSVSVNMHLITFDFNFKDSSLQQQVAKGIQTIDSIYFSNPEVKTFYNFEIMNTSSSFDSSNRVRIKMWPNQTVNSIETQVGIQLSGVASTSRRLLAGENGASVVIPPFYYASPGQISSFKILFNHIYTLVFFVKLYLIVIRPFVPAWTKDPLQLWLTHFVISVQTLFLFGFNALDLKGMASEFFLSAAVSSFRFMSWDPVPRRQFSSSQYYFQGTFSMASEEPAFIQEMAVFVCLYVTGFIGGNVVPKIADKFHAIRTAALLCYLPQVWFAFFTGAFNMLLGGNYSLLNYFSLAVSIVLILIVIADTAQLLIPPLRAKLDGAFGNDKQGICVMYEISNYQEIQNKVPLWYHSEIYQAVLTGIILAVTINSGIAQIVLLFVISLAPIGLHVYQFKITTNRRLTKFKFAASCSSALFMLVGIVLHTQKKNLGTVVVLSIAMMGLFMLSTMLFLGTALLRIIDIFCGKQSLVSYNVKDAKGGVGIIVDGFKKDQSHENNLSVLKQSILDRYLHNEHSRVINDSKNDSEVHVRVLDNSLNKTPK